MLFQPVVNTSIILIYWKRDHYKSCKLQKRANTLDAIFIIFLLPWNDPRQLIWYQNYLCVTLPHMQLHSFFVTINIQILLTPVDKVQCFAPLDDIITTKRWLPNAAKKNPATWHTHFCTRKKNWMADFDTYQINEKNPKTRNSSKLLSDTWNKNFETTSFKWWITLKFNHHSSFYDSTSITNDDFGMPIY